MNSFMTKRTTRNLTTLVCEFQPVMLIREGITAACARRIGAVSATIRSETRAQARPGSSSPSPCSTRSATHWLTSHRAAA
jgi:hypothetical protein